MALENDNPVKKTWVKYTKKIKFTNNLIFTFGFLLPPNTVSKK